MPLGEVIIIFTIRAAALLIAAPVFANDTLAVLGAGGLAPATSVEISMEREDLRISLSEISVHYLFRNNSAKDIDAVVAFPLPDLEGPLVEHEPLQLPRKSQPNFVGFEITVAGKRVEPQMELRALHEGKEITDRLRAAGLPVLVIDAGFAAAVRKLSPQQRAQFEKEELIVSDDVGPVKRNYWPNWTTRIKFYWTQRFPAHATLDVLHKYQPVIGGAYMVPAAEEIGRAKPYCPGNVPLQHDVQERQIRYILTTANNWSGPIRDFQLSVATGAAGDILFTCMPGLKKVAPTRYELVRTNFRPDRDLDLLILVTPSRQ